ncbi:pyrroline-5-carboxylate reductase [Candidatus Entotheonella serta]|nr:pyrroline-5-carboxylate reductase [Candidatus Entotheonella serta]
MASAQDQLKDARIAFIVSGTMGEAMIKGLLAQDVVSPHQILASDPLEERRAYIRQTYAVQSTDDNLQAIADASIIILSIKPQVLPAVMPGLQGKIPPRALLLSIIAGARIESLSRGFGHTRIVRTMPNTPAQVGMAMTVWAATPEVNPEQQAQARVILQALGEELAVSSEHYIDMATGLSGPGPAFTYLFLEAMIDAGVQLGFSRAEAQQMTLQTVAGSVELMRQSGDHPAALRNQATSPGGATAAGLYALEKSGVRTAICDAIQAAFERTRELGALSEHGK